MFCSCRREVISIAKRSRLEQETIINFNEEEKVASVYTFNGPLQRRLAKLAEEHPNECKRELDTWQPAGSVDYTIPKKWIRINPSPKREMTEEQKQAARERMNALHEAKKAQN